MKLTALCCFLIVAGSCGLIPGAKPPNLLVQNYDTLLKKTDNGWLYRGLPFNGYMVESGRDGAILYKLPIINGLEEGEAFGYYNTGEKLLVRHYKKGLQEGLFTQWWPNGRVRYACLYKADKLNGLQLAYYPTGQIKQESHFIEGEEAGRQKAWTAGGVLITNYTVKNNKKYGIVNTQSCLPVYH